MNDMPVGLIGLGLLGSAIAERLIAAGFQVLGFDIADGHRQTLAARGGVAAASAAEVAQACRYVILCLPTSATSAAVVNGLESSWTAGQNVIDTTTGAAEEMIGIGTELAQKGVGYLDATVAGSSAQMRTGEAVLFVGGEAATIEACSPLLAALSSCVLEIGPLGAASRFKLVHNLILGLHRAVLAEGLTLARALGFDATTALALLRQTPAHSAVMDAKGPKMAAGDFAPQATVAQHLKDVRLMIDAAHQAGLALPLSACHERLLDSVVAAGLGGADNSAIITAFEKTR
jgi:3-hydroxyisobutyrate dehydrogenase-like beta-hydroxyacid dehydrogenase